MLMLSLGQSIIFIHLETTSPYSFLDKVFLEVVYHCLLPGLRESDRPNATQLASCLKQD